MESIEEVILFCSSVSQACIPVIQVIQQFQLPVKIVRLDSTASREAAQNGPYFQIKVVPTLVVTYRDGNLQLFVGQPKTIEWLKMVASPQKPGSSQGHPPGNPGASSGPGILKHSEKETRISLSSDEDENIPDLRPLKGKKKPRKVHPPSPKKSSTKDGGLYGPSKKKKKKKTKASVEFYSSGEDDESGDVDIEFVNDGRPPAPPTGGLMVGSQAVRPQRMKGSSLADMAKQMEKDREQTLPWMGDKNIPVYN